MELDKIAGLPAHPLLVHLPIVLIPLASIALVLIAVSTTAHQRLRWYVLALAVVATGGTVFAAGSGEALEETVVETAALERHEELGEQMRPIALLLLIAVIGLIVVTRLATRRRTEASVGAAVSAHRPLNPALRAVLVVGAVGVAVLNTVWIVRTGHEGAEATWSARSERSGDRVDAGLTETDDDHDDDDQD